MHVSTGRAVFNVLERANAAECVTGYLLNKVISVSVRRGCDEPGLQYD